jgi:hypothetical protein
MENPGFKIADRPWEIEILFLMAIDDGILRIDHAVPGLLPSSLSQPTPEVEGQGNAADEHQRQENEEANERDSQQDNHCQDQRGELDHAHPELTRAGILAL